MDTFVVAWKGFELADGKVELSVSTLVDALVVMMEQWRVVYWDALQVALKASELEYLKAVKLASLTDLKVAE